MNVALTLLHNVGGRGANIATFTSLHRHCLVPADCRGNQVPAHCRYGPVPAHGQHGLAIEEEEGEEEGEGKCGWT